MKKKIVSALLAMGMVMSLLAGCGGNAGGSAATTDSGTTETATKSDDGGSAEATTEPGEVTEFTMFITMPGFPIRILNVSDDYSGLCLVADESYEVGHLDVLTNRIRREFAQQNFLKIAFPFSICLFSFHHR